MLNGKRILLIIGGGIAAFKLPELIRRLRERGASVTPVLTKAAQEFVTPLTIGSLAGEKVYTDLFDLTDEAEMGHIQLSRVADLVVVAPATADLMAKMAQGQANDLASTLLLYAATFQFPDGIQVLSAGALRGLKDTRVPMFIAMFAYWGLGMPL
ncbi:MAG: flavoprotein, partial [Pseudomonadota bacterium]|nr:flavoprotein [Pseudomonadota bacterium]